LVAYDEKFLPVARIGDVVKVLGNYYLIERIEPIQPTIIDLIDSNHANLTSLAPYGTTGYETGDIIDSVHDDFSLPDGWFGQWRIKVIDDIMLKVSLPEASNVLWTTKPTVTYLMRDRFVNTVSKYQSGATTADVLLWSNSELTTPPCSWKSKLTRLVISEEGVEDAVVRFGDYGEAGGDYADATNAVLSVNVSLNGTVVLNREDLEYEFTNGIVFQTNGGNVRITAEVEEDSDISLFAGSSNKEFFTYQDDKLPVFKVMNRLKIAQTKARISRCGWKFKLSESLRETPKYWTTVPI
jgi:hypothetical protein